MKRLSFLVLMPVLILSCGKAEIDFNSVKSLDQWYSETSMLEGFPYWGKIAYPLPPSEGITVSRLETENGTDIDFYFPAGYVSMKDLPVIIFPRSFKKTDDFNRFGRGILTMEYEISWGQLFAGEGFVVVKYETDSPSTELAEIVSLLDENRKALRINTDKIGLWSISEMPSVVLQFLASDNELNQKIACSAFFNPELKISAAYSFSKMHHVPYFIAIGAADDAAMNKTALKFAEKCKEAGLEYEFYEHPTGGHGFTTESADAETEKIIRACIDFFNRNLK